DDGWHVCGPLRHDCDRPGSSITPHRGAIDLAASGRGPAGSHRRMVAGMAETSQTGVRALFDARGFRRLLIGQAVSGIGDWVATLAFSTLAFDLTRNSTAVAVVLVLRLLPPIFAAPVGGLLADRMDRRLIMVSCDVARAGLILLVPFFGIGVLYVVAFVHECISLLFLPARDASIPLLVPDRGDLL